MTRPLATVVRIPTAEIEPTHRDWRHKPFGRCDRRVTAQKNGQNAVICEAFATGKKKTRRPAPIRDAIADRVLGSDWQGETPFMGTTRSPIKHLIRSVPVATHDLSQAFAFARQDQINARQSSG